VALPAARFGLAQGRVRRAAWARAFRLACEELGPAFVKVGQLVSVRPEQFSAELVAEMSALQDSAPPVPTADVRAIIEREFRMPVEELFRSFFDEPVATASIAQVHRATLRDGYRPVWGSTLAPGTPLAVKIVRPGIAGVIAGDVAAARTILGRIGRLPLLRGLDLEALIDEFEASLARELDLRQEGRFADRFSFDFRDDERVEAPAIVWPLTTSSVLTMRFMDGWRLADLEGARAAGVDCRGLALHGATAFMRQVLVHGRYHADLHPANLVVTPYDTIAYLDFGIVGCLTPAERVAIAQVLAALIYRDPDRALRYSAALGVVIPAESVGAVRDGLAGLIDGSSRADGSTDFARFGIGLLMLLDRHGVAVPAGYGLLVKSLATVEGVARSLYPEIDIIEAARPFVTRLLARAMSDAVSLRTRTTAAVRAAIAEFVR